MMSPQGRASVDTIMGDTDSLIQYCAELNTSAAARTAVMKLAPQTAQEHNADPTSLAANAWLMRELPDAQGGAARATKPPAVRGANIFGRLFRQLKRHKSDRA
jgi:hypothetical protein